MKFNFSSTKQKRDIQYCFFSSDSLLAFSIKVIYKCCTASNFFFFFHLLGPWHRIIFQLFSNGLQAQTACANKRCDIKLRKGRQSTDIQLVDFSAHFLWLDELILFHLLFFYFSRNNVNLL